MAKKKTTEETKAPITDTASLERVLEALCVHQQQHMETLRPMLIGPTGTGKTTLAKQMADKLGLKFLRLLLAQQLPEDIGGWPQAKKDRLQFLLMEELQMACEEPTFVLLDEYDKVRPDVLGTTLTLTFEKAIRNQYLHPKSVIVGAMQPVNPSIWLADETGKALSARFTFLPIAYRWGYIEEKFGLSLPHLHERERSKTITPPVMEATPRTMDCILAFLRSTEGIQLTKPERQMVLYGTMAKQDAEVVEAILNQHVAWVDPVEAAKIDPMATIKALDIHTISQNIGPLMKVLDVPSWQYALEKVWIDGTEDDAKAFQENGYKYLRAECEASPDKGVDVLGDATSEEVIKAINAAGEKIAKVWTERKKGSEKK